MQTLAAAAATAGEFDVVVDSTGTLWVRVGFSDDFVWRYVTEDGLSADDEREDLPVEREPYAPLDSPSADIVLTGLALLAG